MNNGIKQIWIYKKLHDAIRKDCKGAVVKLNMTDRASQLLMKGMEAEENEKNVPDKEH